MPVWPRLNVHRQRHVTHLRRAGACVLAISIGLAILVYRIGVINHQPTLLELLPDSAPAVERHRGIIYGRTGATLLGWYDALDEPAGHAFIVIVIGMIGAASFYNVAHRIEVDEG